MLSKQIYLLLWVLFVHLAGIYLFTKGFLLNRLSLSDSSICSHDVCTSLATHKKAILLVIDALRFDFISNDPPHPASPYHHNILTLPRELTEQHPERSFIFNAYADPPTTTLQRIKGLTTGSLPTFVDIGSSFGGSAIEEDSLIHQLQVAGRKIAFMGDDTWTTVFPDIFESNMSFPYDSFNVEDLHTVDEGVVMHLLPLLSDRTLSWDFAIAHGLGVDHAGHRVGPDHPTMRAKLAQMNDLLIRVVDLLEDDTLLVVIGDHGMDRTGNHGGDSVLETMSAVWIYSKGPILSGRTSSIPQTILPNIVFPGASVPHRLIQQVDIVPSLSLLLGLPIPFNNLGSIIPELFDRDTEHYILEQALDANAVQIQKYTETYRATSSGKELDAAWLDFQSAWAASQSTSSEERVASLFDYNRLVLSSCRVLWAQFNSILIGCGLAVIIAGVLAGLVLYLGLNYSDKPEQWLSDQLSRCLFGIVGGAVAGTAVYFLLKSRVEGIGASHSIIFSSAFISSLVIIISSYASFSFNALKSISLPLVLHALCFASNSFTIWEDRLVLYLLLTSMVPSVLTGFTAPTPRLRYRILGYSAVFAICVRLMAMSTVCREEQQIHCLVSFYSSSSSSAPHLLPLFLALPTSFALPRIMKKILSTSKSDGCLAAFFLPYFLTPALVAGSLFWMLEWAQSADLFDELAGDNLRVIRTIMARGVIVGMAVVGLAVWRVVPVCLEIQRDQQVDTETKGTTHDQDEKKQVTVLGFANAFGSPYLIFWSIFLALVWATTQLTGQIILGLTTIALLAYLEVADGVRDVVGLNAAFTSGNPSSISDLDLSHIRVPLTFSKIVPLALLGIHAFHGTGHQPTIPSMQWKTAFVLAKNVVFPFSQATVILNTLGPHFLLALASPLLVLWNLPPLPPPSLSIPSLRAALGISLYYSTLLLGSAGSAAALRRHLMVWKIFAPRYMFAAVSLIAIDLGALIGVVIGVDRIRERITKIFQAIA
ncbi:hypothetical protein SERLA73DRAFT_56998 [Serpula lacrymans var. lacrymans S7.3]|uniref:Uncharacterized protein n=2 Tax=Serpula lacrymans var. lacrymans TaxID=341189 RepID=F8Q3G6_SERL3|nr:uncharacterized protein SERLADRAFT_371525 [Serpula lacrymans var. lacrymans S7.9]EGN97727.1 hypothetical protein SERLA73DRAFT_56998 [Serpula lacrymans var. lacrymans S7.3]EGO23316.1 hypothetical protein SERLADRAFT_371525 [Serpula lacrymans var. lacrymans S7.9]